MSETFRARNRTALALLVLGKIFGVAGLVFGMTEHRTIGGLLLGMDGLFLTVAVVLSVQTMKLRTREDGSHKQVLAQMLREGTLSQHLRDLKAEGHAAPGEPGDLRGIAVPEVEPRVGIEPTTCALRKRCSTAELSRPVEDPRI